MNLEKLYATPGVHLIVGQSEFFVRVTAAGQCFQLNPYTFANDGELSKDGWHRAPDIDSYGPLFTKEDCAAAHLGAVPEAPQTGLTTLETLAPAAPVAQVASTQSNGSQGVA